MKRKSSFDLSKHMPQHTGMKVLAVMLSSVGLIGLWGSLTKADLVIQSTLENAVQTIQELHITADGSPNSIDIVRLDKKGVYIDKATLGGPTDGILQIRQDGYITRKLVQSNDIENNSISGNHILSGSIMTGHLAFPYPATVNPNLNMSCPTGEVMIGVTNGLPDCVPVTSTPGSGGNPIGFNNCAPGYVQEITSTGLIVCDGGSQILPSSNIWHQSTVNTSDIFYGTLLDDNDGNVGVGLDNPLTKLHVNGEFRVDTLGSSFIVSNSLVGINTLTPQANLDVNGTVRFGSYAGNGIRALGVDTAGFLITTSGALWLQNGSAIFTLSSNVGIGTNTPTEKLHVIGNVKANSFLTNSDKRLKSNIQPLTDSLAKVLSLKPVSFAWNDSKKNDIGFIAQNVEQVFPELVVTDNNGFKSVAYSNLLAPVVQAVKEISNNLSSTSIKYAENEARIDQLEKQMKAIEEKLGVK